MALGRGLLFGFFVGAIATAVSRSSTDQSGIPADGHAGPSATAPMRDAMTAGRSASREERERLERQFRDARRRGDLHPEDHEDDD